jgi:hypothetical protein
LWGSSIELYLFPLKPDGSRKYLAEATGMYIKKVHLVWSKAWHKDCMAPARE